MICTRSHRCTGVAADDPREEPEMKQHKEPAIRCFLSRDAPSFISAAYPANLQNYLLRPVHKTHIFTNCTQSVLKSMNSCHLELSFCSSLVSSNKGSEATGERNSFRFVIFVDSDCVLKGRMVGSGRFRPGPHCVRRALRPCTNQWALRLLANPGPVDLHREAFQGASPVNPALAGRMTGTATRSV